jgi:hypothetical protein
MGRGWGRGMGWGRGRGWGWGPPPWGWGMPAYGPYPYEPTEEDLKEEIEALKEDKKDIDAEIAEIEKMLKEKKAPRQTRGEGGK